jgi:hypothetical protein
MTYEIYRYIFIGSVALAAVMLVVSVLLFIRFKIPKVIGDVTGSTARKAVKEIRNHNITSGDKAYQSSPVNLARGKVTDKISQSGQLIRKPDPGGTIFQTAKISTQEITGADETTVLDETTALEQQSAPESGATTLLSAQEPSADNIFEVEYDIAFIHTTEIIV